MMKHTCSNCGSEAHVERGNYVFKESGLKRVVLQGIELIRCPKCGNEDPIIPRMNDLMRALALATVSKPYRLTGEELRFLRKYLGITAEQFAGLLHVDKTTISKWETNDDPVGEQSDRLIRATVVILGEGLQASQKQTVEKFPAIKSKPRHLGIQMDAKTLAYHYA